MSIQKVEQILQTARRLRKEAEKYREFVKHLERPSSVLYVDAGGTRTYLQSSASRRTVAEALGAEAARLDREAEAQESRVVLRDE